MKNLIRSVVALCVVGLSSAAFSAEQCSAINCDCDILPTQSWVKACKDQEARIITSCVKKENNNLAFCSLHGPLANRLPLALEIREQELLALEDIPNLNNKVAALYWAIIKDFESFESRLKAADYKAAKSKLDLVRNNVDTLFDIQLQVAGSLAADNKVMLSQLAWRDFSADTLSFGSDFYIRGEAVLNSYDELTVASVRAQYRDLGVQLMELSGQVYEQVGFSYANGMRHKHAAKAWKNAAAASALVMAHNGDKESAKFYRFQSAARLHRASYHWVIGSGRGGAEESLAASQKFMDDGSSISSLVEEERQIKASRPYWLK